MISGAADITEILLVSCGDIGLFLKNLGKSEYSVQRGSQFMADIGEKLGFGSVCSFGRFFGVLQNQLDLLAFGNVDPGADNFHQVSLGIAQRSELVVNPPIRAVLVPEPVLVRQFVL